MDQSRRQLMRVLPLAAVAGASMMVAGKEVRGVEVKPNKRYVFKVNAEVTQDDLEKLRSRLTARGFENFLVLAGPVEIFELE